MKKKIEQIIKKNYTWIIFFIALIVFIAIIEGVFGKEIMKCDTISYYLVINYLRVNWLTCIEKVITSFGSAPILLIISLISVIVVKNKKISFCIIINLATITILNLLLKSIVQRPRPDGYRLISEKGYSFPSGHSMVSTAFYGLIIYFIYKKVENKMLRNILIILLSLLIMGIVTSRVYLGVHYASDVIAGFATSIAYLVIFIKIIPKLLKEDKGYAK